MPWRYSNERMAREHRRYLLAQRRGHQNDAVDGLTAFIPTTISAHPCPGFRARPPRAVVYFPALEVLHRCASRSGGEHEPFRSGYWMASSRRSSPMRPR
jgi:hypothetical protein